MDDRALCLQLTSSIADLVASAASRFNREFVFRCGPEALVRSGYLIIHPYDVADFLSFVPRSPATELALFRLRREAQRQIADLPNAETLQWCLSQVRWNEPSVFPLEDEIL